MGELRPQASALVCVPCFPFEGINDRKLPQKLYRAYNQSTIWQEVINSSKKSDSSALSTDQSKFPVAGATGNSERVVYCNGCCPFLHFSFQASLGHLVCVTKHDCLRKAGRSTDLWRDCSLSIVLKSELSLPLFVNFELYNLFWSNWRNF